MDEFALIKKYFTAADSGPTIVMGIGDDCAVVDVPEGEHLAITTDTLVEDVHFSRDTNPYDLGYKSLAVNLSDLAAMGATPAWATLALTLPRADETWLAEFSHGFFALAKRFRIKLIGGDTTRGPLTITVQAHGFIPRHQEVMRSGAKPGDLIYVTGTLGDAGLALEFLKKKISVKEKYQDYILTRLNRPEPQIVVGKRLRLAASAAIDISDGLAADLGHILESSQVGAVVYVDTLPLSTALKASTTPAQAIELALNAGDDYELCFTVPQNYMTRLEAVLKNNGCAFTCIGSITDTHTLDLQFRDGKKYHGDSKGYQHF